LLLSVHEIAIKANQTIINKNNINDILKFNALQIFHISETFSKIFKKLNPEFSKNFHIEKIGITDIKAQLQTFF